MEISVKHIIIIVLLRLIAAFGSIWCDLSHQWYVMRWFNKCEMILLVQNNWFRSSKLLAIGRDRVGCVKHGPATSSTIYNLQLNGQSSNCNRAIYKYSITLLLHRYKWHIPEVTASTDSQSRKCLSTSLL